VVLSAQLREIASWRITAELVRRYPGRFTVIETHPGGGQYDCLSFYERARPQDGGRIDLNRAGSAHVLARFDGRARPGGPLDGFWEDLAGGDDPKRTLDRLCDLAGLPPVPQPPPSAPDAAVYRFVAAFLAHAAFGRTRWECRNGCADSSDGSGVREDWFARFPLAAAALTHRRDDDLSGIAAYRFWYLLEASQPRFALETTGCAYDEAGSVHNLAALLRSRRRIWPVVTRVAGDLLP
jgi:hypothetical protein